MSQVSADLLKHICRRQDTLVKAEALLRMAAKKTGAGTEYSLGGDAAGLPAICAYLASQQLGNEDVSEKMALQASCLARKNFNDVISLVLEALEDDEIFVEPPPMALSYTSLLAECHIGRPRFVEECLKIAEGALLQTGELPSDLRHPCNATTLALFCWLTCTLLNLGKKVNPENLANKYGVQREDFNIIVHILETSCRDIVPMINNKVDQLRKAVAKPLPSSSPTPDAAISGATSTRPRMFSVSRTNDTSAADSSTQGKKRASASAQEGPPATKKPREASSEEKDANAQSTEVRSSVSAEDKKLVIRLPNVANTVPETAQPASGAAGEALVLRAPSSKDPGPVAAPKGGSRIAEPSADKGHQAPATLKSVSHR